MNRRSFLLYGAAIGTAFAALAADKAKCVVCGMEVDPKTAEKSDYQGKTYYFCSRSEKAEFDKAPQKYVKPAQTKKKKSA